METGHDHEHTGSPIVESVHNRSVEPRRAFSLPDLSAVGLMVSLLLSLVPLSLHNKSQHAKQVVCLDHLRAIGTATAAFTSTHVKETTLPVHPLFYAQNPRNPTFIGAYEWGGKSGIGRDSFLTGTPGDPLNSKYGTKAGFGPATRPLNEFLYKHGFRDHLTPTFNSQGATLDTRLQLDAYRCPADNGPPLAAHCPDWIVNPQRSSYDQFGTSYAANLFMSSAGSGAPILSNSPFLRSLFRVPNPARTINYEENIGRWAWSTRRENDECFFIGEGVNPGPAKTILGWHGKAWTFNHGYVDGHAERRTIYIPGTEDAEGFANHYVIEHVFDKARDQDNLRCLIVRGDGWQKDTLPDPRIDTGLIWNGVGRPSYEDCVQTD